MTEQEFWARAFLTSRSWTDDGDISGWDPHRKAARSATFADAALAEYRKRFDVPPHAAGIERPQKENGALTSRAG